jgi:hypothetical protein
MSVSREVSSLDVLPHRLLKSRTLQLSVNSTLLDFAFLIQDYSKLTTDFDHLLPYQVSNSPDTLYLQQNGRLGDPRAGRLCWGMRLDGEQGYAHPADM